MPLRLQLPLGFKILDARLVKYICLWLVMRLHVVSFNNFHIDAEGDRAGHKQQ